MHSLREIASNAVEYDDILLSTLKGVDGVDLYGLAEAAVLATAERSNPVLELADLRLIWGYDTDHSCYLPKSTRIGAIVSDEVNKLLCEFSFIRIALGSIINTFSRVFQIKEYHSSSKNFLKILKRI